jgi:hypothetical protein
MPRKLSRVPNRIPAGTTYVLEARGHVKGMVLVHRHVLFPDGRQIELAARLVPTCATRPTAAGKARTARDRSSRTRTAATVVP